MFKILVLLTTYLVTSFATTCFTQNQIQGSDILFTYKGKVYDTTGYRHPGGQNDIKKLVGHDLSEFVNSKSESFHLDSSRFYSQLNDMYVGNLQSTCPGITTTTAIPSVETTIPSVETTSSSETTTSAGTTTSSGTTTSVGTTSSAETTTTTETTTTDIIPIINSSNKIVYSVFISAISMIAIVLFN